MSTTSRSLLPGDVEALLKEDDEKWENEHGIKFVMATQDNIEELNTYMTQTFYPHEPISRSVGVSNGNGLIDKYVRNRFNELHIADHIKTSAETIPCSIIARNTADDKIVGCSIGSIRGPDAVEEDMFPYLKYFDVLLPGKLARCLNLQRLLEDLHYDHYTPFKELKDPGDLMYFDSCACVSPEAYGKGLAREMCMRKLKVVKAAGCRYSLMLVTGVYSQRLVHAEENVEVLHEATYADYKHDGRGRPFLCDTREHKVVQLLAINHGV